MNDRLHAHFVEQAGFCAEYGSPFTARLIEALGADLAAGGPTAALVGDWAGSPRADALSVRLAGALHAAVLTGRAPALEGVYPAAAPNWSIDAVWPLARAVLVDDQDWVAEFIKSPPQTNEVRRAIGLLAGFLDIASRFDAPMETLEIGASAGLNLNWDRFRYEAASWRWGARGPVTIDTDWRGPPPALAARPVVRTRAACDQNPLDISDPTQRLRLRAYVWADQADRLARFDGAADMAIASGVQVERADAADWLERKLAARSIDAVTVVYHSIFLQYPPRQTQARIAALIEAAGAAGPAPLVWLRLEPEAVLGGPRESLRIVIDTITWPGGERRVLGETDGHVRRVQMAT